MTVRPDNRLADAPMTPVTCGACGARVLARKSSWEQTSVQWDARARSKCLSTQHLLREKCLAGDGGGVLPLCAELRVAIETAVRDGSLPVLDER
ncbi:hypothetical protein [Mycolicibacterium vanbaalenii]|uniref:Ferredoxin n=1 Tax=Mycolicibacterium vanbaalenii (strain DSM 7251 / JCM 13017 / BCRC 16820 / KCTC 9966 / NRRL B-24157 / PYR-1) TaxID=350058 RepID=A1T926_MYCVP|nr:hypothetical protein [Mycolicibacterium vanbaalenii]ABM13676.1 conserved hypothetical protein [Mycolicibacterium vanbaalenii PYR-1]MCV7126586.1 hypothetical protein [Mycolicibacterium vanbaalenii PYR-1]